MLYINNIPIGGSHITKDISKVLKIDLLESEKLKKTLNETDVTFSDVTEDQISDKKLNKEEFKDLLNKIIYARIEEIISMSFKNNFFFNFLKNDEKSILINLLSLFSSTFFSIFIIFIGVELVLIPVSKINSTKFFADPSKIGTSLEFNSTIALSTPNPYKAPIRCSIVETSIPKSFEIVVHKVVLLTL